VNEAQSTSRPISLSGVGSIHDLQTVTERHRAGDDGIKEAHDALSALTRAADSR